MANSVSGLPTSQAIVVYEATPNEPRNFLKEFFIRIFRESMQLQKFEAQNLKQFSHKHIVMLFGTSTAGKTSLMQRVLSQNPSWFETGVDACWESYEGAIIQKHAPDQFKRMVLAITPEDIAWSIPPNKSPRIKEGTPPEVVQEALKALNEVREKQEITPEMIMDDFLTRLYESVKKHSLLGSSVIFEVIEPTSFLTYLLSQNFSAPIKIGLVYCPFAELATRVIKRNIEAQSAQGDKRNARRVLKPLFDFAYLYEPAKPGDLVLETLTREKVEAVFEASFRYILDWLKDRPKRREFVNKLREETKEKLLKGLGFGDPTVTEVHMTPKFKRFHFLFNTSVMRSSECAATIRQWKAV